MVIGMQGVHPDELVAVAVQFDVDVVLPPPTHSLSNQTGSILCARRFNHLQTGQARTITIRSCRPAPTGPIASAQAQHMAAHAAAGGRGTAAKAAAHIIIPHGIQGSAHERCAWARTQSRPSFPPFHALSFPSFPSLPSIPGPGARLGVVDVLAQRLQLVVRVVHLQEGALQHHLHLRDLLLVALGRLVKALGRVRRAVRLQAQARAVQRVQQRGLRARPGAPASGLPHADPGGRAAGLQHQACKRAPSSTTLQAQQDCFVSPGPPHSAHRQQ